MLACYKMHLKRMFTRREYMFVVTVLLIMLTAAFVESCRNVFGWLESSLNSAALGWIMHTDQQPFGNTGMRIFVFFLFGILAALVYGDSPCIDKKARALFPAVVRTKGKQYEISGALAAFTGAFVTFFTFFLLSQLLALIVFPVHSSFYDYYAVRAWEDSLNKDPLFPVLFFQYPYLNNLVYMIGASFWAGVLAVMAYTVSLFIGNRLFALGLPQLFLYLMAFLQGLGLPFRVSVIYYLYPTTVVPTISPWFFFLAPMVVMGLLACLITAYMVSKSGSDYL